MMRVGLPGTGTFFAPGKLVLCGEYAVLEPGGEGLCAAVSAGVAARASEADRLTFSLELLGGGPREMVWDGETLHPKEGRIEPAQRFVSSAVQGALVFLSRAGERIRPFALDVRAVGSPEVAADLGKPGLGMSAASTVAAVAAVFAHHSVDPLGVGAKQLLLKVALDAHRRAQGGEGSGIDVAASVYGGVIRFCAGEGLPHIERIDWPADLPILAGFSGVSVETAPRVASVEAFRLAHPVQFTRFVRSSTQCTYEIVRALGERELSQALEAFSAFRTLLITLGEQVGLQMEIESLQELARVAAQLGIAKQSGAGGGDCAILILTDPDQRRAGRQALRACGFLPLDLQIPGPGLSMLR